MAIFGGKNSIDENARGQAASAASEAASAKREIMDVDNSLSRMTLICAALWELVKEHTNLTETDLLNKIAEIDAKDGVMDGKFTATARHCIKCQRVVQIKQTACMYCGTVQPIETASVFETI